MEPLTNSAGGRLPRDRERSLPSYRSWTVPGRSIVAALVALALVACSGDDDEPASPGDEASVADAPAGDDSVSPPPSLAGGVELSPVDPAALFVGDGLAYGTPLPSESAAVEAFADDAEVAGVELRRVRRDRWSTRRAGACDEAVGRGVLR